MLRDTASSGSTSITTLNIFAENIQGKTSKFGIAVIGKIINAELACLRKKFDSMFIQSDVSGCVVAGLSEEFQQLICQAVCTNCPYCNCGEVRGITNIDAQKFANNLNSSNSSNSSDNLISFFHEDVINDDNYSNSDYSSNNEIIKENVNNNFISKNLLDDDLLIDNNLKIITLGKIKKGKWLCNGNISVEIPNSVSISNFKLRVYLNGNVVDCGEIELGSHQKTNSTLIKTHTFNLMFVNNSNESELNIALMTSNNSDGIKLLKTTNFFANLM